MQIVVPGRDPLGPIEFWSAATKITFFVTFEDGRNWSSTRHVIVKAFEDLFTGMFDVLLGDESKLGDNSAEYVLYIEPEEAEKAIHYLKELKWLS
jgi:hypothetical protein